MGVAFSHGTAQWSYSGFAHFRRRLARDIGLALDQMQGYAERWGILWSTVDHPLVPLLYHSDCDGYLSPGECRAIAPALREIVQQWEEDPPGLRLDKWNALELAAAMEDCAEKGEPLEFC